MKKIILKLRKHKSLILLSTILLFGFYLRTFNINWDSNYSFHPDERAIALFTIPLEIPLTAQDFFSSQSSFNPHFFAYGNFPIYLLFFFVSAVEHLDPTIGYYGKINLLGRLLSSLADTGTILVLFLLGKKIFSNNVGLLASLFYAIAVLPIQLSHFYAVDTLLTFFMISTLYIIILLLLKPSYKKTCFLGLIFGLSLATKISALSIVPIVALGIFLMAMKKFHNSEKRGIHLKKLLITLSCHLALVVLCSVIVFFVTQPYALIDFGEFVKQTQAQSQMTKSAFTFPYTLQYVGIIPYYYELQQVFLWGYGPILTTLALFGFMHLISRIFKMSEKKNFPSIIIISYFFIYFLLVGSFKVGWMRYMLPLYPILAIFSSIFVVNVLRPQLEKHIHKKSRVLVDKLVLILLLLLPLLWTFSFISIYQKKNTRLVATEWIHSHIPIGSVLAIEHWDDALPVYGGEKYIQVSLPLYEPDTENKWTGIDAQLEQSDYIILASNRLYVPLQKLTNCANLPPLKCYPLTATYYKRLFSGKLGFRKVAEFSNNPRIPFTNFEIDDQSADESFTVNDHPKIIIFQKNEL